MAESAVVDKIGAIQPAFSRRAARLSATAPAAGSHESIPFDSGHAYPGLLPDLTAAAQLALTKYRSETLQYGVRPGLPEMREFIAGYMNADGATVTPDEILIVNGAKHGLDLLCRLLLDEGDSIVVTAPTYFTSIPIFNSFGIDFVEVGQDDEGFSVSELESALRRRARKAAEIHLQHADFHNPTGVTMSRSPRSLSTRGAPPFRHRGQPLPKVRFEQSGAIAEGAGPSPNHPPRNLFS